MFNFFSPLEQFEIISRTCGNSFISFLNIEYFLIFISFSIFFFLFFSSLSTFSYFFLNNISLILYIIQKQLIVIIIQNSCQKAQYYYPLLYVLGLSIIILNLTGIIPYSFTLTSHFVVTFFFSFRLFIGFNISSLFFLKYNFFSLFLPSGAPVAIAPFLILIELVSYTARVFSLAIRLFANIIAGHSLLKILIGFTYAICFSDILGLIFGVLPFLIVFLITFLEFGVALIQAYVFIILLCVYLKDFYSTH